MAGLKRTVFFDRHLALGARMVEFGGWQMPLLYRSIVEEHLATRTSAGLFDVSHMGRFLFRGDQALPFLQHVLTNDASALATGQAQYTIIPNTSGGAIDDAYLYRFFNDQYMLVVNAANRQKDYDSLQSHLIDFDDVELTDHSESLAMIALQGPRSQEILSTIVDGSNLPEPGRNRLYVADLAGNKVLLAHTGYTGEPVGFELFIPTAIATAVWDALVGAGASAAGLGARDTLRLEASLPLYGHEMGLDSEGLEIPIFASALANFAVSLSPIKGNFIGREPLAIQQEASIGFKGGDFSGISKLPRMIRPIAMLGNAVARHGAKITLPQGRCVGYVTSGTAAPYHVDSEGNEASSVAFRGIGLALIDSDISYGQHLFIDIRSRQAGALVVPGHVRSEGNRLRPILYGPTAPTGDKS